MPPHQQSTAFRERQQQLRIKVLNLLRHYSGATVKTVTLKRAGNAIIYQVLSALQGDYQDTSKGISSYSGSGR
jgi:hypothetical protein